MDSLVIDIQSTSTDATKSIDTLITRLSSLRDVLKEVSTASNGLSNLKKIGNGVRTSSSSKRPKIEQPKMLYKNIDVRPGFEKIAGDIGKVDSATSMLRNKFNTLGISLKDTKIIDTFSDGNKVITKYATKTWSVITVTDKLRGAFGKTDVSVKKTNTSTKKFSDDFKKTTDIINKVNVALLGAVAGFGRLAQKMGDFVNQAGAEQEALNLFTVTMGQYAKQGVEWIERFSDALYLDPVSVMQYMGSFNSLVKGLGVGAENSYKMSQNLTQLVYDLASFKNITVTSAYEKLMSGISGELEPLRNNAGVAMSEATLQTLAYNLGIEKLVRNMTEAEKAQLRYIQIMRSSTEWQTDMGRTLITPANALRVMRQQFVQLGRAIGKVFIPIIMSAMPYVIAITQMLTALAQKLANFLGYEIADIDYSGLGDISAGITDIGTSADKTAEKLNTMLAPFDDLNVVQNQAKNASSGLGGIGGDLGVGLPEYDALANLNEKFAEGVDKAKKNLKTMLPIVLAIGGAFATWKITGAVAGLLSFFGIGKGKKGATSAGSKGLTTLLPTWKTLFKGMAQLATLIGGVVLFIEALGLLTRIPGFKENITTGINILTETFWGIAKIAIPLAGFSASVSVLGTLVNPVTMLKGIGDLALVIGGLELVVLAVGGIMSIPSLTNVLDSGIKYIQNVFNGLSEIALPLSGFTLALGLLGLTGGAGATAILTGLGLFAEVIIGLQVVVGTLGGLSQIPGFTWLISEGGKALSQIGSVLGGFAGSIAEAFTTNFFDSIPTLGTQLSDFMTNAKPFFDGIVSIDDSIVLAVKTLADTILILTATNIIEGLTSWFAGETSLVGFGKELADFAPHFARYADAIKGINADVVVASSNSAKSIAEMANTLPNRGGLLAEIMGENDLSEFGKMLPDFGKNLKKYSDNVSGIDSGVVTSSANVAKAIAEMATTLPNDGGLLGLIMGENDLKNFGKMLPDFGKNLKKYAENVKGVDTDVVTSSINSAKAISSLASGLENQGGMISWFTGDNKLSTFGKELKSFGDSFKKYYDTVKNISMDKVNNITNGIGVLVGHLKTISTNKLNPILKDFGTNLSTASTGIKSFFSQTFSSSQASSLGSTFGAKLGESIKSSMKNKMGTSISLKNEYGTNLATYSIRAYESGGYPTSGDLFFANENGVPEMIGRIGNQTAVANNDQIATSLTNALISALNQYDFGGGQSPTTIYIGNRKVYEGYGEHVANENDRYGTNMIKI